MRVVLAVIGLLVFTAPALAEFWVGQNASSKKCDVYDEKPDGTNVLMIGTTAYATREEAKAARKEAAECKGNM